ncbi:DUF6807 domain-containing protein [Edaphobacter bradus]|uniref:DUF6807 domain-containing protein n=1 Tax=Edaphobacter bradus TaxID=2259016 RepID=UPI0021E082C7|nr:PmoA family protein [Edaphobacter bradus]
MRSLLLGCALMISGPPVASAAAKGVQVVPDEGHQRVDITIDGQPFTSYTWPSTLKKPVLFPLIAEDGVTVTRGYPLAPRETERVDHPHHAGMWFNYGNVNGFDFWNNSDAIKDADRGKMGTINHTRIVSTKSGKDRGELVVDSVWVTGANKEILKQTTRYVFSQKGDSRVIDVTATMTALDRAAFRDDKEGVLGIRVAHFLESATEKGGTFADASGRPTTVGAPTAGATGVYLTSEGKQGDSAWGTRGRWCELVGTTGGHTETVAVFDHTGNPGYPTYWHARGYGLFAANPLGRSIFDPKQAPFNYTLEKGQSTTFHYSVMLFSHAASADEMNRAADAFNAESK